MKKEYTISGRINKSAEERRKFFEDKGCRWFSSYLDEEWQTSDMSEETKKQLFGILRGVFRGHMRTDEEFRLRNEAFLAERRTACEKRVFFRGAMTYILHNEDVRQMFAAKYPDKCKSWNA